MLSSIILDDKNLRNLPPEERFSKCESIIKGDHDESLRWDAVWIAGELANDLSQISMFNKVSDLMAWVLKNDKNGVIKHEACYQIAARNMRKNIPNLVEASLSNESVLTRHEALESLGLMRAFECEDLIKKALEDPSPDVRETAEFVLKRFKRLRNLGQYVPSPIL